MSAETLNVEEPLMAQVTSVSLLPSVMRRPGSTGFDVGAGLPIELVPKDWQIVPSIGVFGVWTLNCKPTAAGAGAGSLQPNESKARAAAGIQRFVRGFIKVLRVPSTPTRMREA